jgi:transposase InsO family protein
MTASVMGYLQRHRYLFQPQPQHPFPAAAAACAWAATCCARVRSLAQISEELHQPQPVESGQYTSAEFAVHPGSLNLRGSMGQVGQCWDNALAESFFSALKTHLFTAQLPTRAKARCAVVEYIGVFYNRVGCIPRSAIRQPTRSPKHTVKTLANAA